MRRRSTVMVAGMAMALVVGLLGPPAASADTIDTGLRWGGHVRPGTGQSETQAVQGLEARVGRKLGAVRDFRLWDQPFPTSYDTWLHDTDHLVLLSVKPANLDKTKVTWRTIADAQPGSAAQLQIDRWAQRIKAWGKPIEFTFHHEPEVVSAVPYGSDADFIAAWRHVVDSFRLSGVTNARYLWIMTDYGYDWPSTDRRYAPKWYPGDAWVDDMSIDAYNWYHCRTGIATPWRSLATIIESFRRFGASHPSKRLWLTEWASAEDTADPARKPQWIADAQALFKQPGYAQFDGISTFDHIDSNFPSCNWRADSSAQSLQALRVMGADGSYQRGMAAPPK